MQLCVLLRNDVSHASRKAALELEVNCIPSKLFSADDTPASCTLERATKLLRLLQRTNFPVA